MVLVVLALPVLSGCLSVLPYDAKVRDGALLVPREMADTLRGPTDVLELRAEGRSLYLRRLADGSFAALSSLCTHRSCQIGAEADGYVCPCHGSRYDLSGRVVDGPAERPLPRYQVDTTSAGLRIIVG